MKKTLVSLLSIASSIAVLVSCAKETTSHTEDNQLIEVTLIAGNPEAQPATKTEMNGTNPLWSVGDVIGVTDGSSTIQNEFSTGIAAAAATASFTGTTVSGDLYAYYPYTSNGVTVDGKAKVDIPVNQNPTASSFDGAADILVAKKFTVDPANTTVENLEFARLGAIVKLVLIDKESTMTGTQRPTTVSLTAASDLVGRVYVDMPNQELGEIYYNNSKTVTANYTAETKYAINGANAAYLIVYPQTLAEGSTLTVSASTDDYSIEKEITVPAGGIELLPGKVNTLNVNLLASHITLDSGDALPFDDNMAWANNGASDSSSDISSSISTESSGLYTTGTKAYKGKGGLKLGTGSASGSITTKELNLSGAFYIAVKGGKYGSDTGTLEVSVDGEKVITGADIDGINYVNIAAGTYTKKSKVTIETSVKRGYLYSVKIKAGEYTPDPVINVTSENPLAVTNANDLYAIEYNINNPTDASISAVADVAWIHDFDYSTAGEVIFEVDAQEAGADARSGVITLSYAGAEDVKVEVNQAAGAGGTTTKTATINFGNASGKTNINSESVTGEDSEGHTWTITTVGTTSFTPNANYSQVGSSKKPATSITFTTTLPTTSKVTSISADFGGFNGTEGKISLKVGDTTVGTGSLDATNDVTVSSTVSASGTVLTVIATDIAKGVKVYSITVSYEN